MSLFDFFRSKKVSGKEWKDIEYFDTKWIERIRIMSQFIPKDASVMDLGCGKMWLKGMIPLSEYIGVDYKKREDATIVCDFNKYQFPDKTANSIIVSGCLEYVKDYKWFISEISNHCERCIISYCTVDETPQQSVRKANLWVNDLSKADIIEEFRANQMFLTKEDSSIELNCIFVFDKDKKPS